MRLDATQAWQTKARRRAEIDLHQVVRTAWLVTRERKRAADSTAQSWTGIEAAAVAALDSAQATARHLASAAASEQLVGARLDLELARQLAQGGDLAGASQLALRVQTNSHDLEHQWQQILARFSDRRSVATWRTWVAATIAESKRTGHNAFIVDKLDRRLDVYDSGRQVATFPIELGVRGLQRKLHAGDRATPEGRYRVTQVKVGPATRFYKALLINYPNPEDRRRHREAIRRGQLPRRTGLGGLIEIHGDGGRGRNWTDGCVALTNADMDRLIRWSGRGTLVTIVGNVP